MSESYYVIDRFSEIDSSLASIIEAMPIKRKALDIYLQKRNAERARNMFSDLEHLKNQLLDCVKNLGLLFSEVEMSEGAEYSNKLYSAIKGFNLKTADYTMFISALNTLINYIPQTEKANARVIGNLMNNVKMGYYPTDLAHVEMIKESLVFPLIKVNVFDPCCGCGLALEHLCLDKECITFGTEIDDSRGKEAETRMDKLSKPEVKKALIVIKKTLTDIGIGHKSCSWNPKYKGLDDYFYARTMCMEPQLAVA